MLLNKLLKANQVAAGNKSKVIYLDFEKNYILATDGFVLVKTLYDFELHYKKSQHPIFKDIQNFSLNPKCAKYVTDSILLGKNLFDILGKAVEAEDCFPKSSAYAMFQINLCETVTKVDNINITTATLLKVCEICQKLEVEMININFRDKKPFFIKNDSMQILLAQTNL